MLFEGEDCFNQESIQVGHESELVRRVHGKGCAANIGYLSRANTTACVHQDFRDIQEELPV